MENKTQIYMNTFPVESQPKIQDWFRFINTPVLNLNLIDDSFSGRIIKEAYPDMPYETIQMIREMSRDNKELTEKIISSHNAKMIGL
jgi:hypothetical protein